MPKAVKQTRASSAPKGRTSNAPADNFVSEQATISAFRTELGWFGLLGINHQLSSVFIGHPSEKSVVQRATALHASVERTDWAPAVRQLLEAYTEGEVVDFSQVEIQLPEMTPFRQQIVAATRRLGYGEVASYGELARRVGRVGAARAVGTVMSTNQFPIVIPCHRVIAAGGKLGGFTSYSGTVMKERMLELEARAMGISRARLMNQVAH